PRALPSFPPRRSSDLVLFLLQSDLGRDHVIDTFASAYARSAALPRHAARLAAAARAVGALCFWHDVDRVHLALFAADGTVKDKADRKSTRLNSSHVAI